VADKMTDKDPVDEAIAAYAVPAPDAGLAERVAGRILAGTAAAGQPRPGRRPGPARKLSMVVLLAAAAATVVVSLTLLRPEGASIRAGASAPAARETITLGSRATLVAEAGALVRWWPAPGAGIVVEQTRGEVFYRVDAGPLTVETPRGTVRVLGTCFHVEVTDMKLQRQTLLGAAAGAALASAVVVTVYEGRVSLASGAGHLEVAAGERAVLDGDQPPRLATRGRGEGPVAAAPPAFRPAPVTTPPAEVNELQALRARVTEQEKEIARLRTLHPASRSDQDLQRFVDPPPEELQARAQRCEIAFVTPGLDGPEPRQVSAKQARELGMSDTERDAADEVMKEIHTQMPAELRKLYLEISGDSATAARLSTSTLMSEILQKAPEGVVQQARIRLSRERAGLVPPPANPAAAPPVERALRLFVGLADDFERRLGERIGPDRARSLRGLRKSWGSHSTMSGCPGQP
jgi:hypothetical protein